jgi:hypothetical protein
MLGYNFYRDIAYIAYVLNLIIQDILKISIKDKYYSFNNTIARVENNKDKSTTGKFL